MQNYFSQVDLGLQIRKRRNRRYLSQAQFAKMIGVSVPYLDQLERGVRVISVETLVRIALALGTTLDDLLRDAIKHIK